MQLVGTTTYWVGITEESPRKPVKVYITKDGDYDEILLSTSIMKRWGILPEDFPKVDKEKFSDASEDVNIDDTQEQVANHIRRLEALQEKEKEEEERAKDPLGRSKAEILTDEEREKIKEWAIQEYPEVFESVLGSEDRIRCEPVRLERKPETQPKRKKKVSTCAPVPINLKKPADRMIKETVEANLIF